MSIRVIIADDHPIFLRGLEDIVSDEEGIELIGSAQNGEEAYKLICEKKPDVAILDIDMPIMTGLEVADMINEQQLKVEIGILTMFRDRGRFNNAISNGVKGYLLKENTIDEVGPCIRSIYKGRPYISPDLSQYLLDRAEEEEREPEFAKVLTKTEKKVIKLIADAKTTQEIADALFVSRRTIDNHRSNICTKLNLRGANVLLRFALENRTQIERIRTQ